MKTLCQRTPISIAARAVFVWAFGVFSLQNALAQAPAPAPAASAPVAPSGSNFSRSAGGITLNFVNAEIAEVARTMAVLTGRNVLVDPRVRGTMNLVTEKPMSAAAAYNQFLTALRLQNFVVVDSAGISKIVPEAEAKLLGGTVTDYEIKASGNQIVTQIFRLNYESAGNLLPILRPLISPNNVINVNNGNNSLIITDYADNLKRMARLISALDVSNATDLEIYPLKHTVASDLVPLLQRLSDGSGGSGAAPGQPDGSVKTSIIAESRSNSVIVRASHPVKASLIKSLIDKLDRAPAPGPNGDAGNIYVVYLKNADAVKLATTLRAAIAGGTGATAAAPAAAPAAPAPQGQQGPGAAPTSASAQPSTGGQIQADPATNALIISASEPQYRQIRAVIDRLDSRRAQVFVESMIAEVNSDKAAELGIQWQGGLGKSGDSNVGFLGTNLGATSIVSAAVGLAGNAADIVAGIPKGINFGVAHKTNGVYVLGFLANWIESTNSGNVISRPNLLTLDNEEAKIIVGQNVPFITGQQLNNSSGGTQNPFQTIERKDVGLTLRVKPQISENGTIRMMVYQEISTIEPTKRAGVSDLITNKRAIESQVLVEDGGVVILGGLLEEKYNDGEQKVPGLGDIPFFGRLFKTENRSKERRELMLFLRPVVVRDAQSTGELSLDRYDLMRSIESTTQPIPSGALRINEAPTLPPLNLRNSTELNKPVEKAKP
jgi:general secretion pathway protein D